MKGRRILAVVCIGVCVGLIAWKVVVWRQLSAFRSLTSAMKEQDVVRVFGKPAKIDGSGFAFLHYHLLDGSEVVVVCASELRVVAVTRNGEYVMKTRL